MNKKVLSAIIALALSVSVNVSVMASPSNTDKTRELENKVEAMDTSIESLLYKIENNKQDITKNKEEMDKLEKDIKEAEKKIESRGDLFNKRVRAMYISGLDSYADIILESKGLNDLISRLDTVKKVMGFDQGVIKELKDKKEEVKNKKVAINKKNSEIVKLKSENESKLAKMEEEKSKQQVVLKDFREQQNREAVRTQSVPNSTSYSRGGSSVSIQEPSHHSSSSSNKPVAPATHGGVVGYAMNFQGTPYVYGGTSPSGFDCSGFVQYVYRNAAGINLARDTYGQVAEGTPVSRDQLQPGDLVFPSSHHVGIYVGGGQMIHAPHTGDVVRIAPVYGFYAGRRIR